MPNLIDQQGNPISNRVVSLGDKKVDLNNLPDPHNPTQNAQPQVKKTLSEELDAYIKRDDPGMSTKVYGENFAETYGGSMSGIDDHSITPSQENDVASIMSQRQSGYQQAFNALVGGAAKGVLGVGQSVGLLDKLFSDDDWETSALYDTMTEGRDNVDKAMPIFTDPNKKFSWDSSMFWSLTSGLVDNAVQFGVVGGAVGKTLGLAGEILNLGAKEIGVLEALEKLADGSAKGQKAAGYINALKNNASFVKALNSVPAGIIMNDIEGTMEGLDVYKQTYQDYKDQHFSDEEAQKAATAAAAKTKNLNRLLVLQDIFALHGIFGSKDKFTNAILNEPRLFKRWSELKKGMNPFNPDFWNDFSESQLFNMLGEGAEELTQGVISAESQRAVKYETNKHNPDTFDIDEGDFGSRLKSYLTDDDILYQGLAGAYGGGAQRWAANAGAVIGDKMAYRKISTQLNSLKEQYAASTDPAQKQELERQIEIKQKDLESTWKGKYDSQQELIKENEQLKSSFTTLANGFELYDKAVVDGDEVSQELLTDNLFTNSVVKNLRRGTIESFQQQLQDIVDGNVDDEIKASFGEDHVKKAQDMLDMTKKMRKDYIQSQSYLAAEEVFFLNQNIANTRKAFDTASKKEEEAKNNLATFAKGLFDFEVNKSEKDGVWSVNANDLFDVDNLDKRHAFENEEDKDAWNHALASLKTTKEYEDYKKSTQRKEMVKDLLGEYVSKKSYLTNNQYEKHLKALNILSARGEVKENLDSYVESIRSSKIPDEGKLELYKRASALAATEAIEKKVFNKAEKVRVTESLDPDDIDDTEVTDKPEDEKENSEGLNVEVPEETTGTEITKEPSPEKKDESESSIPKEEIKTRPKDPNKFIPGDVIEWDVEKPSPVEPPVETLVETETEVTNTDETKDSDVNGDTIPEDVSDDTSKDIGNNEVKNPTTYSIKKFKEKFSSYLHSKNVSPSSTLAWLDKVYKEFKGKIKTISNERIRPELNSNKKYNNNTEVKFSVNQNSIEFKSYLDNPDYLEFPITIAFDGNEVGNLHTPVWIVDLKSANGLSFFQTQEGRTFLKNLIKIARKEKYNKAVSKIEAMFDRLLLDKNGIYDINSFRNTVTTEQTGIPGEINLTNIASEFVKNVKFRVKYQENNFAEHASSIRSISAGIVSINRNNKGLVEFQDGKDALPDPGLQFVIIKDGEAYTGRQTKLDINSVLNDELHSLNGTLAVVLPLRSTVDGKPRKFIYPVYMKKVSPLSKEWKLAKKTIDLFLQKKNDPVLSSILDNNPISNAKNLEEFFRQYITFIKYADDALSNYKIHVNFNDEWSTDGENAKERCVEITIPKVFKKSKYLTSPMQLNMTIDKNNVSEASLIKFLEKKKNLDGSQITPEQFMTFTYNDVISLWLQDSYLTANTSIDKSDVINNDLYSFEILDVNDEGEIVHTGSMPYNEFLKERFTTDIDGTSKLEDEYIYNDQPVYDLVLPDFEEGVVAKPAINEDVEEVPEETQESQDVQESQPTDIEAEYDAKLKLLEQQDAYNQSIADNSKANIELTEEQKQARIEEAARLLDFGDNEEANIDPNSITYSDEEEPYDDSLQISDQVIQDQLDSISAVVVGEKVSLSKQQEAVDTIASMVKFLYFGQFADKGVVRNKAKVYEIILEELKKFNSNGELNFVINNYDNFKKLVEFELASIGFTTKQKKSSLENISILNEKDPDDISSEAGQVLEKYSDSSYQLNPIEGASGRLKARLGMIRDTNGDNLLGIFPRTVNAESLFMEIKRLLADIPDLTWEKALVILKEESNKPNKSYLERAANTMVNKWSQQDKNEFMSVINGQRVSFNMVVWESKNGNFFLRTIDSNRVNAESITLSSWNENFKNSNYVFKHKGETYIDVPALQGVYASYVSSMNKKDATKQEQVDAIVVLLNEIGIDVSQAEMESIANKLDAYKKSIARGSSVSTVWNDAINKNNGLIERLFSPLNIPKNYKKIYNVTEIDGKDYIHIDDFNPVNDSGDYKVFARHLSKSRENLFTDSFKNVNKDTIFGYGMYYHLKEVLNKIKEPGDVVEYANDPFINDSYLYSKRHLIDVQITDGLNNTTTKKSNSASEFSEREIELRHIALIQNQGKESAHVPLPTLSDKSQQSLQLTIPKINVWNDKFELNTAAITELLKLLGTEINRINNFKSTGNLAYDSGYKYFYFLPYANKAIFDEAVQSGQISLAKYNIKNYSDDMWSEVNGVMVPVDKNLKNAIVKYTMDELVEARIKKWERLNLTILPNMENGATRRQLPFDNTWLIKKGFKNQDTVDEGGRITDDMHPGIIKAAAMEYEFHTLLVGSNFYQVFAKDPALYYKPRVTGIEHKNLTASQVRENLKGTMIEAVKRNAKEVAPGKKPHFIIWNKDSNSLEKQTHYKSVTVFDKKGGTTSEFVNKSIYAADYKKIDNTDAQEYTSLQEHLHVAFALGYIDLVSYQRLLEKADLQRDSDRSLPIPEKALLLESDFKVLKSLQIQKPVQVVEKVVNGKVIVQYVKSSSMPLFRQITEDFEIDELTNFIDSNKIDRVAYTSAVKAGAINVVNLYDEKTNKIVNQKLEPKYISVLSREGFYIQQEVPYDEDKDSITTISQMNALITAGIDNLKFDIFNYDKNVKVKVDGKSVKYNLVESRKKMFEIAKDQVFKDLDLQVIDGRISIKDINVLRDFILQEAISRKYPENDIHTLATADNRFIVNLFFNPSANKFESLLTSIFTKIVHQKVPGKSYVQTTGADWKPKVVDETKIKPASKKKIVHTSAFDSTKGLQYMKKTPNGYVTEIMVPWDFKDSKGDLLDIEDYMTDGRIDFSKFDPEMLQVVGARIPNQGHNSMSAMEIVGFLPPWMGDTVIVPVEITKQMGADFDVDKLYTYRRHYQVVDGILMKLPYQATVEKQPTEEERNYGYSRSDKSEDLKQLQNQYFDLHWTILTHPEISSKIIEPLDKDDLEREFKMIKTSENNFGIGSAEFNQQSFIENRAGKKGVAIESLAVVFNVLLQGKGVNLVTKTYGPGGAVVNPYIIKVKSSTGKTLKLNNLGRNAYSYYDPDPNNPLDPTKKRTIEAVLQIIQNEAVDNAKKGSLGGTNINNFTFGVANALAMLSDGENSVGLDTIIRFLTQESVMEYVNMVSTISDSLEEGSITAKKAELKNLLLNQYKRLAGGLRLDDYAIPSPNKLKELRDSSNLKGTPEYYKHQYGLLEKFFELEEIGDSLQMMQRITNISSKGIGQSFIQTAEYAKIYSDMAADKINTANTFINFENTRILAELSEIKHIFNNAIYPALDFSQEHFPYDVLQSTFIPYFEAITGSKLNTDRKRQLFDQVKAYILTDELIHGTTATAERARILSSKSPDNLVIRLNQAKQTWGKNNYLLKRLNVVSSTTGSDISLIEYAASTADRIDSKNNTKAFIELFVSDDPIKRNLARDLVVYSLLTNPNQSATNFVKFIPSSIYLDPSISNVLNINMNNLNTIGFNFQEFMDQYFFNNPNSAIKVDESTFKSLSKVGDSVVLPEYSEGLSESLKLLYTPNLKIKTRTNVVTDFNAPTHPFPYFYTVNKYGEKILYKVYDNGKGKGYTVVRQKTLKQNKVFIYNKKRNDIATVEDTQSKNIQNNEALTNSSIDYKLLANSESKMFLENIGLTTEEKDGNYIVKLLEEFSKDTSNPDLAMIAELLLSNPQIFEFVTIKIDPKLAVAGRANSSRVVINPDKMTFGTSASRKIAATILHELIHVATSTRYELWKNGEAVSFKERELFTKLEELREQAIKAQDPVKFKAALKRIHTFYKEQGSKNAEKIENDPLLKDLVDFTDNSMEGVFTADDLFYYALINTKEFITGLMTDKEFQAGMNQIVIGKKSIAEKFSEWISHFLDALAKVAGIQLSKTDKTILTEGIIAIQKIITESNTDTELLNSIPTEDTIPIQDEQEESKSFDEVISENLDDENNQALFENAFEQLSTVLPAENLAEIHKAASKLKDPYILVKLKTESGGISDYTVFNNSINADIQEVIILDTKEVENLQGVYKKEDIKDTLQNDVVTYNTTSNGNIIKRAVVFNQNKIKEVISIGSNFVSNTLNQAQSTEINDLLSSEQQIFAKNNAVEQNYFHGKPYQKANGSWDVYKVKNGVKSAIEGALKGFRTQTTRSSTQIKQIESIAKNQGLDNTIVGTIVWMEDKGSSSTAKNQSPTKGQGGWFRITSNPYTPNKADFNKYENWEDNVWRDRSSEFKIGTSDEWKSIRFERLNNDDNIIIADKEVDLVSVEQPISSESKIEKHNYYGSIYDIKVVDNIPIDVLNLKQGASETNTKFKERKQKILNSYNESLQSKVLPKSNDENLKTDSIYRNFRYELFPDVYANEGQRNAIDKIENFLSNDNDKFLLKGRGGTGKTTIIKKALQGINKDEVVGATIADEARQILQENMPGYKTVTVASLLGLVPDYNSKGQLYFRERNEKEEENFRGFKRKDPIEKAKYIVIDEASMINDYYYEMIIRKKKKDAKIIFMGDNAQIPPINEEGESKDSPVWNLANSQNFAELTERMRQGAESPILPITDLYANNIENIQEGKPGIKDPLTKRVTLLDENKDGVEYVNNMSDVVNQFINDYKTSDNTKEAVIIGARNETVDNANDAVRKKLFNTDEPFVVGDYIRVNSPYVIEGVVVMPNGFKGKVYEVIKEELPDVDFTTYKIRANFDTINPEGKKIKEPRTFYTVSPKDRSKYKAALSKLAVMAKSHPKGSSEAKSLWSQMYNLKDKIVDIGYGYAITAHKVQGSTYNRVYVLEQDIMSFPGGIEQQNRMMYTAVSRPRKKLVIYNPTQTVTKGSVLNSSSTSIEDKQTNTTKLPKQNIFTVSPLTDTDKKAKIKASVANKFIGFAEGIEGSSTEEYRKQAGKVANVGNYSPNDVVFVSIGGKRMRGANEQIRKEQQDKTIREAIKALEAGATVIADNVDYIHYNSRTREQRSTTMTIQEFQNENGLYNLGEKRLYEVLKQKGYNYSEQTIDGQVLGVWNKNQPTEIKPNIDSSKKIEVSKVNYTKNTPNDKSKGFFFTENLQAYLANRGRGAEERFDLASKDVKLDVTATNNQAGIRRNNGIRNLNAFAIISKKYQQNGSGSFVKEEGQFKDTDEDFELFKKYNTEAIDEAIAYNKPLVIAEAGIATGKSALPLRFAEWLNNELKTKLGIQGTIKENTSTGYKGYGIFNLTQEQPIVEETITPTTEVSNLEGIDFVFEQNPELANEVYSKILTNSGLSAENVLSLLLKDNIIEKQCS